VTQIDERPGVRTPQVEPPWPDDDPSPRPATGRLAATIALLVGVAVVMAMVGYLLAGGRLTSRSETVAGAPASAGATAPPQPTAASQPTVVAAAPTAIPAPTLAPTAAPTLAPTAPPQPTSPPPKPTAPPPTPVPPPTLEPTAPPAPKPANPAPVNPVPAAPGAAMAPVRPGMDTRQAQIEGKIREYFEALNDGDFARAQQVCCTAEWRSRYPLARWQHNFDGVTDLRLVGAPRYLDVRDDRVDVETDYTFVSGGVRHTLTLPWTFRLVNGEWQGDMAEAYAAR
jgi:hypothetical protein